MNKALAYGLAAALASAACSSDTSTPAGGNPDASSGGSAGSGGTAGTGGGSGGKGGSGGGGGTAGTTGTGGKGSGGKGDGGGVPDASGPVALKGTVVVGVPGHNGSEAPLAGVSVCVVDTALEKDATIPCVTTDAQGAYTLAGLPQKKNLIVLFQKAGYVEQIVADDTGVADATRVALRLAAVVSADAGTDAGAAATFGWDPSVVQDLAKGELNTFAVVAAAKADAGSAAPGFDFTTGVSFAIKPAGGDGPFYVNPDESWASTATSTVGGYGAWFLNLTPGTYTVTATSATLTCSAVAGNGYGWAQPDGSSKAPVIKGVNTQSIGFFCTAKASDAGTKG